MYSVYVFTPQKNTYIPETLNFLMCAQSSTNNKKNLKRKEKGRKGQKRTGTHWNGQKFAEIYWNWQKPTENNSNRPKLKETDRNRQTQSDTDKVDSNRQKQTETDRKRRNKNLICDMLRVICHLSLTPTGTATDPPPAISRIMHSRLVQGKINKWSGEEKKHIPTCQY